jgi:CRP-like cAMP-binding protein
MDVRQDVVDILSGFALFADLSTPELENIVQTFGEVYFADGERVIRQGLTATGFYVIVEGGAIISVGGKERASLRPGDFFGEISCLLGEPPTADIIAKQALRCLVLAPAAVEEFLVANPHVMYRVLQGEARKLRTTTRWLG